MHILLTGGGTGGHIIPLLAVAHEIKKQNPDAVISYAGERGSKFAHLTENWNLFADRHLLYAGKFRRYHGESLLASLFDVKTIMLNVRDVFLTGLGIIQAYRLLRKSRPDVIFIKGGFVGVPVGIAAAVLKIPFITHDSDIVPGLANRIVARWASLHATGMPVEFYSYPKDKTVYVGIPVPPEFRSANQAATQLAKKHLGLLRESQLVVITGGSQGSVRINTAVRDIVHELLTEQPYLHIVHHVGRGNEGIYSGYAHERLHIEPFIDAFAEVITAADVVVTRGGANSLAELGTVGKPTVVIPSPFLAGGHQLENAKYLAGKAAVVNLDEQRVQQQPEVLKKTVIDLLNNRDKAQLLAHNLQAATKLGAAKNIANLVLKQVAG